MQSSPPHPRREEDAFAAAAVVVAAVADQTALVATVPKTNGCRSWRGANW